MDATDHELPVFPTAAPEVFGDPEAATTLLTPVLDRLAGVVEVDGTHLDRPTPCAGFTVSELRQHVLAWLAFFAAALSDPTAEGGRPDPASWASAAGESPADVVRAAAGRIEAAARGGVADELVVMSQARMAGDGVLAMALGEYLVHGWDLAVATGRRWAADEAAAEAALAFLRTTVAPEHRGPDSGFFDAEVPAPEGASAFERLLCFAGRDPAWRPPGPTS